MENTIKYRFDIDSLEDQIFIPYGSKLFDLQDLFNLKFNKNDESILIHIDHIKEGIILRFSAKRKILEEIKEV